MQQRKWFLFIASILILSTTSILASCSGALPSSSTTAPVAAQNSSSEAQQILTDTISAMEQVSSFNSYSAIFSTYQVFTGTGIETSQAVERWVGSRSVDMINKEMHLSIKEDDNSNGIFSTSSVDQYIDSQAENWEAEIQLPNFIELLNSSQQEALLSSDIIDGQPCYILSFVPSAGAAADWAITQGGTQYSFGFFSGVLADKNSLTQNYKGGIFQLWISSDSKLVLQALISPVFETTASMSGNLNGLVQTDTGSITENITLAFSGEMEFSDYNEPVSLNSSSRLSTPH
jgi:hypothetical protein